ncbi:MAG TPA: S8/S53 family peptidase, partial [Pseudonocardiaceae bacterium]|nr:S8/S53 family peptidase [Pseudonocardiaceae bacterium]
LQVRSTDPLSLLIGANLHLTTVSGTINPYPRTEPHPHVLAPGVLPVPTPEVHPFPRTEPHVGVLNVDDHVVEARSPSLPAGHAAFVHSLILDQAPDTTVTVRSVPVAEGQATAWDVARAMMALADTGVHVINLSAGCRTPDGEPPLLLRRVVELLRSRVVLVAAAGNDNLAAAPTWPAALPGVVAVGARNIDDSLADFSPRLPWVTCTAPGSLIIHLTATVPLLDGTSMDFEGNAAWSGTAFAAATVSGAIAAHTVLGQVTAQEALAGLLAGDGGVVRKYVPGDDGQRA